MYKRQVQGGIHGRGRVVFADGQDLRHGLLGVLVGLIDAVGKGHGLVLHPFAEAVREDLIEHLALDAFGGLEVLLIDRDLPAFAILPADHAAVVRCV